MDIRHALHKYKQQKDRGGDCHHGFLLRRWQKATKPTAIAGPLFLVKKCLAWGKLATGSNFHWREDSAEKCDIQRRGQLPRPAYMRKKISSKANIAFFAKLCNSENFPLYGINSSYHTYIGRQWGICAFLHICVPPALLAARNKLFIKHVNCLASLFYHRGNRLWLYM